MIDIMHKGEKWRWIYVVMLHHTAQRGAVLGVVLFLELARLGVWQVKIVGDKARHACIDLGEEIARCRIERIVQIENPIAPVRYRPPDFTRHRLVRNHVRKVQKPACGHEEHRSQQRVQTGKQTRGNLRGPG